MKYAPISYYLPTLKTFHFLKNLNNGILIPAGLYLKTSSTPGEGKIPTNWIREKNFDVIAFPELFCDGKGGLNAERKIKLTIGDFYSTRQD